MKNYRSLADFKKSVFMLLLKERHGFNEGLPINKIYVDS